MRLCGAVAACLWLTSCAVEAPVVEPRTEERKPVRELPRGAKADDAARYLAGLSGRAESPFKAYEASSEWIEHARQFDAAWSRWDTKQRPLLEDFHRTELEALKDTPPTVFYPFGGPDVLNAVTLFPDRDEYVLVGLEPPGTVDPNPEAQLGAVRVMLASVLNYSFFITNEMNQQMRGQVTDGVLPVMLVQLVREGYTILGAEPVSIEDDTVRRNPGVAIEFTRDGSRVQRAVYYTANLHDARLKANEPFLQFLGNQPRGVTFLKSTSYLPHKRWFSMIRDHILNRSAAIVQDDSGVPYRFFDPSAWDVRLYGSYEEPIPLFKRMVQDDLAAAYRIPEAARTLGFRIGYSRSQTNLQVAIRKGES